MPSTPDLTAVAAATERLLATARALTDADVDAPSLLPGWTVGHVLTHVARNADGNRRMAEGAARGVVLDQYEGGAEGRAADIAAGAGRSAAEQVADLEESARRLADAWAAMPEHAWHNTIRPLRGEQPASDGPVSRRFEVEVHHVDLGLDAYGPHDWPATFVHLGLERVVRMLRGHAATIGPPATWRVDQTDGDLDVTVRRDLFGTTVAAGPFDVGPDSVVRAPGAELLAWLLGRRAGVPGDVDGDAAVAAQLPAAYPWQERPSGSLAAVAARTSPLDTEHRALGAKMVPFGGWEMPLAYGDGTLAEHRACRERAVAFDVSHLGTVRVRGEGALERLQAALTNDLRKVAPGRAQYTHLLEEADASVLDDIIVWWRDDGVFDVMPNASNTARVLEAIGGDDVTAERAVVAVQGPDARALVKDLVPGADTLARFHVAPFDWGGEECWIAATGYTGEDGVECAVPAGAAAAFWRAVLDAGIAPAGLGARDTLRLEAGLPLHGHELGPGITPLQAGLGWVVGWDKGEFRGRAALAEEKERGVARRLRGLVLDGRQPPREGYAVRHDGTVVGTVTSGNFSPVLNAGIAMAFLPPALDVGAEVEVDLRGRPAAAQIIKLPFVDKRS